jgi:hypothetical protein
LWCDNWHIRLGGCTHLSKDILRENFRNLSHNKMRQ